MKKSHKKNLVKYGVIFVLTVVLVYVAILLYQDEQEYHVPEFVPKSTEEVCELETEDLSRRELIDKLADSLFGEDHSDRHFRKNPVEFYSEGTLKFVNNTLERRTPPYSVGYMYDLLMSAFLSGYYYEDTRYLGIYEVASKFLYENTTQFNPEGDTTYWHLNRDSACYPLHFPEALDDYSREKLEQLCIDLYRTDFLNKGGYEGSYCPKQYTDLQFLTDLAKQVAGEGNSIELEYYKEEFGLYSENHAGKAKDFLYLYQLEGDGDRCKIDAFFKKLGDHLLFILEDSSEREGKLLKVDLMEVLNTVSYGLKSDALSAEQKAVLESIKEPLLSVLIDSKVYYGGESPYGSIETSYMEICLRDPLFFDDLPPDKAIFYTYENDCEFEEKLTSSMIERACDLNDGETVMLFSSVINTEDGDKISYASTPYTSRVLTYLILLDKMNDLGKE